MITILKSQKNKTMRDKANWVPCGFFNRKPMTEDIAAQIKSAAHCAQSERLLAAKATKRGDVCAVIQHLHNAETHEAKVENLNRLCGIKTK